MALNPEFMSWPRRLLVDLLEISRTLMLLMLAMVVVVVVDIMVVVEVAIMVEVAVVVDFLLLPLNNNKTLVISVLVPLLAVNKLLLV